MHRKGHSNERIDSWMIVDDDIVINTKKKDNGGIVVSGDNGTGDK